MSESPTRAEGHTLRRAIDRPALLTIRDIVEETEPLATPALDDFLDPSTLVVRFDDGLCEADEARIDIQWTTRDDYRFHDTDTEQVNVRWEAHQHGGDYVHVTGHEHYHPPPDASSDPDEIEDSHITQSPEVLVTRAVFKPCGSPTTRSRCRH